MLFRFEVDETSPEETMVEALYDEDGYTYQILSKPIGAAREKTPLAQQNPNKQKATVCCNRC